MAQPTTGKRPDPRYRGQNGFDEETRRYPRDNLSEREAVEAMDMARFVMREMGSFFPSFEEMKRISEAPDNLDSVNERIRKLKKDHADSMTKLGSYHAQTSNVDALDRYHQFGGQPYPSEDEKRYDDFEAFFKQNAQALRSEFTDVRQQMTYDFLQDLMPLLKRRRELEAAEGRRSSSASGSMPMRRMSKPTIPFPSTAAAFRVMSDKEAQLAVAKFLMADGTKREAMRSNMNWARSATEPLIAQYDNNDELKQQVESLARSYESRGTRMRGMR